MAATLGGWGVVALRPISWAAAVPRANDRLVRRWDPEEAPRGGTIPAEVMDELDLLRHQVAELAERMDFAERLLASPRPDRDAVRPISPS
jgi:hypothetical protein